MKFLTIICSLSTACGLAISQTTPECKGSALSGNSLCASVKVDECQGKFVVQGKQRLQCSLISEHQCATTGPLCTEPKAQASCLAYYKKGNKKDGVYLIEIKDLDGKSKTVELFCDMTNGGWTLIGQIQGFHSIYNDWLRKENNIDQLKKPEITSNAWSSIPAVDMAVNHATEIRFSNADRKKWVKWSLDASRKTSTLWNQADGRGKISKATNHQVKVYDQDGGSSNCNQNEYGIMVWSSHGGAYPAATLNSAGNTSPNDDCMSIGVMLGSGANGFSHRRGGNGFDAPEGDSDWPNRDYQSAPMVSVWLKWRFHDRWQATREDFCQAAKRKKHPQAYLQY